MPRSIVAAVSSLAVLGSAAHAYDASVKSSFIERVEISDNAFLKVRPKGETYTALSTVVLDAVAGTPTTRYALISDYTYRKYLGSGAHDTTLTEPKEYGSRFDLEHRGKRTTSNAGVSWRRRDVASAQLEDVGVATVRGDITTYVAQGSVKYVLSPLDTLIWSAAGTSVDFSSPTATPYIDMRTGLTWNRRVSPMTDLVFLIDFDRQIFDNVAKTETTYWRTMGGAQVQLSPFATLRGNAGLGIVDVDGGGAGAGANFAAFQSASGSSLAFIWDAVLGYKLTPTTSLSVLAAHTIAPTILGDLTKRTSFGASMRHLINHASEIALAGDFTTINSGVSESDLITASAIYSYRWAREWRAQFGYIFRHREDTTGAARSSTVFVSASRDATIVP